MEWYLQLEVGVALTVPLDNVGMALVVPAVCWVLDVMSLLGAFKKR